MIVTRRKFLQVYGGRSLDTQVGACLARNRCKAILVEFVFFVYGGTKDCRSTRTAAMDLEGRI